MNIVFISKLYPPEAGSPRVEITHALHNLVKYWNRTERIVVVRPIYIYLREIFTKKPRLTGKIVYIDNVEVIVFPILKIPKITYFYYPLYRYLDRFLKKSGIKPDMVVAHYDKSLYIGHRYSQRRNLPFTAGLHAAPDLLQDAPEAFNRRCGQVLDAAAAVACRSLYIYNKICQWFPQHAHKCFTVFSGIENHLIHQKEFAINKLNQWKNRGKVSILSVSALIEVKKIDIILEALSRLSSKIDWTYTIVGDGEKRQQLEKLTLQLGIRDRVRFKGFLPRQKVIEEMEHSHIFVLVSILESFGLVYLEAMATGNIVIASKGEGIDGIIQDEKSGFLCPPQQPEPLTRQLEKIILHMPKNTLESILIEAHHTISQYTEEKAAQNYLEQLRNLFNKKKEQQTNEINQKLLQGVQGGGFLEKSPPMLHGAEGKRKMLNIHIYPSNMKNESRIFRITNSLIEEGIVKEIMIVGKGDGELNEYDQLDETRQIWRVPLTRFWKLHWKIRKVLRYIQWLCKIYFRFRKEKIGIVNCHSIFDLPLGAWLKRTTGCQLIYDTHELETERNGLKGPLKKVLKRIEKKYIQYTDHVFVVSDSIARWYREAYGLVNVTTIKNVPRKKQAVKRSKKIRDLLNVPEDCMIYIYQGGFLRGRGIPILLSVFSRSDIHDHIVFMGYGELEAEIKEFARQHQNIHFLEAVPPGDVVEYTSGADVGFSLVENTCLSYYYSLPNKVFEYLVSGIPCIVSDFPEMSAFVTQYQSGWTSAVEEESVYTLITEISRSKDMIRRKKQGITKVLQRDDLGWEHEHRKLIQVYKDLINKDN